MADETTGQAPTTDNATPHVGNETVNTTVPQNVADLPDWAQQQIRSLRSENADRRTKLTEAEKKLGEYDAKTLTETEKLTKERDTLTTKATALQERVIASEIKVAAASKGGLDPDIIALAVRAKIELGEDGEPTNVGPLIDQLAKDKPFLFGQGASGGNATSATNGQRGRDNRGQTFSRSQLRDPAFYRTNEKEILAAVKEGRITED